MVRAMQLVNGAVLWVPVTTSRLQRLVRGISLVDASVVWPALGWVSIASAVARCRGKYALRGVRKAATFRRRAAEATSPPRRLRQA
jgi:hypothetical protein